MPGALNFLSVGKLHPQYVSAQELKFQSWWCPRIDSSIPMIKVALEMENFREVEGGRRRRFYYEKKGNVYRLESIGSQASLFNSP